MAVVTSPASKGWDPLIGRTTFDLTDFARQVAAVGQILENEKQFESYKGEEQILDAMAAMASQ